MAKKYFKHILVTDEIYQKLKERGKFQESFNDILSEMLKKTNGLQQSNGVPAPNEIVVNAKDSPVEDPPQ